MNWQTPISKSYNRMFPFRRIIINGRHFLNPRPEFLSLLQHFKEFWETLREKLTYTVPPVKVGKTFLAAEYIQMVV